MTLLAGIISRTNQPPPVAASASLRQLISRDMTDEVTVFENPKSYLLKVDIGVFGETAIKADQSGAVTLLAGEPLLTLNNESRSRSRDIDAALIHDGFLRGDQDVLKRAQGAFCAVHYQPATGALSLIGDKLGLRPLYYWVDDQYLIFASALRILEGLSEVPKKMDLRGVTEIVVLGSPLADRTPYVDIFLLGPAEVVEVTEKGISRARYWSWDDIEPSSEPEESLLGRVYGCFETAVARRIKKDTTTLAYLSGGLDSRCVVGALHSLDVRVHTFNFARPGTQDQVFGREFARQVGAFHEEVPKQQGDLAPDYSSMMARVWSASKHRKDHPAERPGLVWSGEGGSLGLGHIHMNEKIVRLLREGEVDAAIDEYIEREYAYVPTKLLRPKVFAGLAGVIKDGILGELENLRSPDPGRAVYLFLMLNEQRRKLSRHFENIDLHRLEFQLPYFDSAFLASVAAIPIELCLGHKFYVKWLTLFHPSVTAVPWQAYPGHVPCPISIPAGIAYQWAEDYQTEERASQKQRLTSQASELLRAPDFPDEILSKRNLRLAVWIHSTGWRDYAHIIEAASTYHAYWKKCGGEYTLASR